MCAAAAAIALAPIASTAAAPATSRSPEDKNACIKNLKVISQAIQAYQADHKDLPNWLSDLVSQYLPDTNVLICPVCRRTGAAEGPPLGDPKIACSYLFEFCPLPLGTGASKDPTRTRREWKRRQMGLVGSAVPVVRCRHHRPVLNLGFDGVIYESAASWELTFTNRVSARSLTVAALFAGGSATPGKTAAQPRFPAREPEAGPGLIDLSKSQDTTLVESGASSPLRSELKSGHGPNAPTDVAPGTSRGQPAPPPVSSAATAAVPPPSFSLAFMTATVLGGMVAVGVVVWLLTKRKQALRWKTPALVTERAEDGGSAPSLYTVVVGTRSATEQAPADSGNTPPPQPLVHIETPGVTQTHAEALRQRALAAEQRADCATAVIRRGLIPYLSYWLKQKLVRKLVTDRAQLLEIQQAAAHKALAVEERLARIEQQIRQQNMSYQARIEELTRELLLAKEESRELIRARIAQVKAEMEAARDRLLAQSNPDDPARS
jgi:hypothetical protein